MNKSHKNLDRVGDGGLSGRSVTLAMVVDKYRMDCSNDIEMHEPSYI
jgi:hypothetical protein